MRRRITALVAATTSVVLLAFLIPSAYLVSRVARSNVEARAQAQVQALIPVVVVDTTLSATQVAVDSAQSQGYLVWVTLASGRVLGTDPSAGRLAGTVTATIRGTARLAHPQARLTAAASRA